MRKFFLICVCSGLTVFPALAGGDSSKGGGDGDQVLFSDDRGVLQVLHPKGKKWYQEYFDFKTKDGKHYYFFPTQRFFPLPHSCAPKSDRYFPDSLHGCSFDVRLGKDKLFLLVYVPGVVNFYELGKVSDLKQLDELAKKWGESQPTWDEIEKRIRKEGLAALPSPIVKFNGVPLRARIPLKEFVDDPEERNLLSLSPRFKGVAKEKDGEYLVFSIKLKGKEKSVRVKLPEKKKGG